jgi:uncharacterized protein (TIGR02145 family)
MKNLFRILGIIIIIFLVPSCKKENNNSIIDADGNVYTSVIIGTQVWLVENLKTTRYKDGTSIQNITDKNTWSNSITLGYCWYDNNISNKDTYGALYNWYALNTGKLCPTGWHVPSEAEWTTLITYLDGESIAGGKLKEVGTTHWTSPNNATNETGFTALPGGYRHRDGVFRDLGSLGYWWSATELDVDSTWAWFHEMSYFVTDIFLNNQYKKDGFSIRCVKD